MDHTPKLEQSGRASLNPKSKPFNWVSNGQRNSCLTTQRNATQRNVFRNRAAQSPADMHRDENGNLRFQGTFASLTKRTGILVKIGVRVPSIVRFWFWPDSFLLLARAIRQLPARPKTNRICLQSRKAVKSWRAFIHLRSFSNSTTSLLSTPYYIFPNCSASAPSASHLPVFGLRSNMGCCTPRIH